MNAPLKYPSLFRFRFLLLLLRQHSKNRPNLIMIYFLLIFSFLLVSLSNFLYLIFIDRWFLFFFSYLICVSLFLSFFLQGLLKESRKSCRAKRYVGTCMKGQHISTESHICMKLAKIAFQLLMKIWDSVYISL